MKEKSSYTPIAISVQKLSPTLKKLRKFLLSFLGMIFLIGTVALAVAIYFFIFYNLPSPASLKDYRAVPLSSQIFDRNGKLLYEVYREQNRTRIKIATLPSYVSQASIAIEDKDYYRHGGISVIGGILRAAKDTITTQKLQGGSTITQQLVKSALLTSERTIQRKIKEIILATWAEKIYSKNEILEMYLNQVPYGGSSYGIEQASQTYFGKPAEKLTIAQAALLAGLPQAPSLYSPYFNPDLALARRNEVLKKMLEQKYISVSLQKTALNTPLSVIPPKTNIKAPHFVFYVKSLLEEEYGTQQVEEGGLKITTTLDMDLQQEAEQIIKEEIDKIRNLNVTNGAVLVTRPPTGEILAMIGSDDYFASPSGAYNVTTAFRQPGSSIKPINYAIGIDRGLVTAASILLDVKTCFSAPGQPKAYCPRNYDGVFHGPVGVRYALASSYNIPAVKMLAMNTVTDFVASSSAFTITSLKDPQNYGLSLTLGGGEIPMVEMAQAYSALANRGKPKKLRAVLKIEDKLGKTLFEFKDPNFIKDIKQPLSTPNYFAMTGKNAISEDAAFIVSHILQDNGARVAAFGSNSQLVIKDKSVSVKTGTTDDLRDNWTIGYTPDFLTAVWVGNNDFTPMNPYLVSGITGAAPIWNRIMTVILQDQPDIPPVKTAKVVGARVCTDTGYIAGKDGSGNFNCPTRFEYLIQGKEQGSSIKVVRQEVPVTKDSGKLADPGTPETEMKEKTVLKDQFGMYCVDCAHDAQPTPRP
ncbi:hypothetical protein A3F03_03315 [Candidatus Roizmanbacteria bacterium RIFCSPHIGHO2_12_FULL_41_11]|uniref:Uncharacterized protein n=2 Tax=Candidatus Roizmaniibacteriota TaxID=1752723 RepID=A0A1F7JAX8_9BACT|nr:MAG: hypothetical protein A3F03_03315 [Candidatus Roizmanbacteria bacterium RIFCSPHIGHO2_12_FULL_41_11]OGK52767.1 MAG: hypothetical protein A2966_04640 [Candidatus Roizmanbacteria bacterium RIFCSPLOWO2_01_FULL_41_22]